MPALRSQERFVELAVQSAQSRLNEATAHSPPDGPPTVPSSQTFVVLI